jgi:hypothetical protein
MLTDDDRSTHVPVVMTTKEITGHNQASLSTQRKAWQCASILKEISFSVGDW